MVQIGGCVWAYATLWWMMVRRTRCSYIRNNWISLSRPTFVGSGFTFCSYKICFVREHLARRTWYLNLGNHSCVDPWEFQKRAWIYGYGLIGVILTCMPPGKRQCRTRLTILWTTTNYAGSTLIFSAILCTFVHDIGCWAQKCIRDGIWRCERVARQELNMLNVRAWGDWARNKHEGVVVCYKMELTNRWIMDCKTNETWWRSCWRYTWYLRWLMELFDKHSSDLIVTQVSPANFPSSYPWSCMHHHKHASHKHEDLPDATTR